MVLKESKNGSISMEPNQNFCLLFLGAIAVFSFTNTLRLETLNNLHSLCPLIEYGGSMDRATGRAPG